MLSKNPNDMPGLADLKSMYEEAESKSQSGDHGEALSLLNRLIEKCELEIKGEGCDQQRGEELRELLALAFNNRGHIKYLQVDFDEAVEDYTLAIEQSPKLSVAHYNRGLIHYRLARFQEAVNDQEVALSIQPVFSSAKLCLDQSKQEIAKAKSKSS